MFYFLPLPAILLPVVLVLLFCTSKANVKTPQAKTAKNGSLSTPQTPDRKKGGKKLGGQKDRSSFAKNAKLEDTGLLFKPTEGKTSSTTTNSSKKKKKTTNSSSNTKSATGSSKNMKKAATTDDKGGIKTLAKAGDKKKKGSRYVVEEVENKDAQYMESFSYVDFGKQKNGVDAPSTPTMV